MGWKPKVCAACGLTFELEPVVLALVAGWIETFKLQLDLSG
jgi:hypothetical protein